MAVSHDTTVGALGLGVASVSVSVTVANNANRYMLISVSSGDNVTPSDLTSVVFNTSETATELLDQTSVTGDERVWLYELLAPSVTTANATATKTGVVDVLEIIASVFYGVDQSTPKSTPRVLSAGNVPAAWAHSDGGQVGGLAYGSGFRSTTASTPTQTIAPVNGIAKWYSTGTLLTTAGVTSRTPTAPAGQMRGDLEIAYCSSENNATHSVSGTGWVKIGQTNSGASWTVSHYYRIYDGTNVDPVISWTGAADGTARRFLFKDTQFTGAPAAYHGTVGTGTAATHTSTGANTTVNDVLAVYIDICNANTGMVAETNWTEREDTGSATGPIRSYLADREFATAASATGDISETGGAAAWVQRQFEIYRSSVANQTHLYEREAQADFQNTAVGIENATTYNALGWISTNGTTGAQIGMGVAIHPVAAAVDFLPNPNTALQAVQRAAQW